MPGFSSVSSVMAATASLGTVLAGLWLGDRLVGPVIRLERCRREVRASLAVAFSLRNAVARRAGRDDIDVLNALSDARKDLKDEADQLALLAFCRSPSLRAYLAFRGYRPAQAAGALVQLSESLISPGGNRDLDRETIETALRLEPQYSMGRPFNPGQPRQEAPPKSHNAHTTNS